MYDAVQEKDWENLKTFAQKEYNYVETMLDEIDEFEVSPEFEPLKTEYELFLIDEKRNAHYMKEYAEDWLNFDFDEALDDIEKATDYVESSYAHLEKVKALLEGLPKPTPCPSPTPSLTPTPTPTPQVEKDSDGDGFPDKYDYAPYDPNVQIKEDVVPKETGTPTSTVPGFEVVFAIGSLLAVAYLVLRRRR